MTTGTAHAGTCYSTQAEAARMWCSDLSAGLTTCGGVTGASNSLGGAISFSWQARTVNPTTGAVTVRVISGQPLQACERYDFAYWQPVVISFISALVAISCIRWLYRFFLIDKTVV